MPKTPTKFHFPHDIKLKTPPLAEAWLEIQWELEPVAPFEGSAPVGALPLMRDPGFPFALSAFAVGVEAEFGYRQDMEASRAPQDMLPHVVRHQFRPDKDGWPLLQLGPGVASVNFSVAHTYTWKEFKNKALYLRTKLSEAYGETKLKSKVVVLRYRNVEPFDYSSDGLFVFLKEKLNTSINLPSHIPGAASSKDMPTSADVRLTFDLQEPKGTATLRLATGTRKRRDPETKQQKQSPIVIWQLEIASGGSDAPPIANEADFDQWLNDAHDVTHEWFLSLVEGSLYDKYMGEGE